MTKAKMQDAILMRASRDVILLWQSTPGERSTCPSLTGGAALQCCDYDESNEPGFSRRRNWGAPCLAGFARHGTTDREFPCSLVTDNSLRFEYCPQMPQALHPFYGGRDLHFLTFSCYKRLPFFNNAFRCDLFLKILERVRRRYRLVVLGYVVMPEHIHLLVSEPQRATLSTVIQALKLGVARSLECGGANPMSRKTSETWGTPGGR
jgi:REP element-mobilizing transposase RayT